MTPTEIFSTPLGERIVWTLAHFLWQGSAIAAVVLLGARLVGRDVQRRYLVSAAGLLLMIVSPLATLIVLSQTSTGVNHVATESVTRVDASLLFADAVADDARSTSPPATYTTSAMTRCAPWLLAAWLLGVAVLLARLMLSIFAIGWLKRSGRRSGEVVQETATRLCRKMRVALPQVRVSARVAEAMVAGFWRPVIILPAAWLAQLPPDCLEAILAHELAHIRRRDLWVNLAQRVVETFLFYHPAVWWLSSRLRHERELCCDEMAVAATGRRVEYVSTLELVARRRQAHVAPLLAAGIGGGRMALLDRVKHVLGLSPERDGVSPWTVGVAAIVAVGGCWWVASGISPLWADSGDEAALVAQADGEREESERRDGDAPRDGEERRDGDRPRDGERPEGDRPRDGDRPREGDTPREGDRPLGPPEKFRRHIQELKARMEALRAEGKNEEAQALEREAREALQRFEKAHRGDRPFAELPAEVREQIEKLKRAHHEAAEAGKRDEAREIEQKVQALLREHGPRGDLGPRELGPDARAKAEELKRRLNEAREAGRRDEVGELERQLDELIRAHFADAPREGDRPRPDFLPPREGDRPRPEVGPGDRELLQVIRELREEVSRLRRDVDELKGGRAPRSRDPHEIRPEGDRPRPDGEFRPDRPRREGDRPDAPRERGDRRPEGERPQGDRPAGERPQGEREDA